jgi:hypothetical protein
MGNKSERSTSGFAGGSLQQFDRVLRQLVTGPDHVLIRADED